MDRMTSTNEEILNYVSKKLATAQLSRRRSQSTTTKRLPPPLSRTSSRVLKASSRHASPKPSERMVPLTAANHYNSAIVTLPRSTGSASMTTTSRVGASSRHERPFTWHSSSFSAYEPFLASSIPHHLNPRSHSTTEWQSSSYDWPGDAQYYKQPIYRDWSGPSFIDPALQLYGNTNLTQATMESSPASYFPGYPQLVDTDGTSSSAAVSSAHHLLPQSGDLSCMDQNYALPAGQVSQLGEPLTSGPRYAYALPTRSSRPQQVSFANNQPQPKRSGEELVGLGLYNKTQDASPKQLCAGLPSSFVPNGSYGLPDNPQKPEETWQQSPDWQYSESTEGSEASASPHDSLPYHAMVAGQAAPFQNPHDYSVDTSSNPFLFESDPAWFLDDPKQLANQPNAFANYHWFDTTAHTSYA